MANKVELKKALLIGLISVSSYVTCYYMRNLLGVCTPKMVESGISKEYLGTLSSFYLLAYAIGQLINGNVGDKVNSKYMVCFGLVGSGLSSIMVAVFPYYVSQMICFILMGFTLSMLRGPLVKVISENTLPKYARICCVFLSFASFLGPLISSLLAIFLNWQMVFIVAGLLVVVIGVIAFLAFSVLQNKGLIVFNYKTNKKIDFLNTFKVFKLEDFKFYLIIGGVVEISAASLNFWLPTYMVEYLGFTDVVANVIFSIMSIVRASAPFIALFILSLFKDKAFKMMSVCFIVSAVCFLTLIFIKQAYINVVTFMLGQLFVSFSSALLWSVYIPSQAKSGMTSTVNGVLDFSGYVIAFVANLIFTYSMSKIGWTGIVIMWSSIMLFGGIASIIKNLTKAKLSIKMQ